MIDPKKVMIACPTYDGKVEAGFAAGLGATFASGFAGNIMFLAGCADIGSARAQIAHTFLQQTAFDWLVFIDADIQFTAQDFGRLMYIEPDPILDGEALRYSRVDGLAPTGQTPPYTPSPEVLVCAEYARKTEACEPVRFGLGFTRIHRSVFEALADLRDDDGAERVDLFIFRGQMIREFFPMCTLGDSRRVGEDGGFWTLCRIAGFVPRIEQGTHLLHWGRRSHAYTAPTMLSAI